MSPENNDADVHADNVHSRLDTTPRRVTVNDVSAPAPSSTDDIGLGDETASTVSTPEPAASEPAPTSTMSDVVSSSSSTVSAPEPAAPAAEAETPVSTPASAIKPKTAQAGKPMLHYAIEAVLLIVVLALGFLYMSASSDKKDLKAQVASLNAQVASDNANPQAIIQKQSDELVTKVGALTKLPTGETPTIALVSDAAAAKQQSAFFKDAVNGDKVLMYVKAGEAILYRPSTNKVIVVAPLTFNSSAATTTTKK